MLFDIMWLINSSTFGISVYDANGKPFFLIYKSLFWSDLLEEMLNYMMWHLNAQTYLYFVSAVCFSSTLMLCLVSAHQRAFDATATPAVSYRNYSWSPKNALKCMWL